MKYKITMLALLLLIFITGCQSNILTGKQIFVTPATGMMKPGLTLALEVIVKGRSGKEVDVTPGWTVENPLGTLDRTTGNQVVFTALKAGTTRIKVTAGGLSTYTTITIVEPVLTTLALSPSTVRMGIGQAQQLVLTALDQFGDPMAISPIWTMTPLLGTVNANHRLTATSEGRGTVMVTAGNYSATLDLTVETPVIMADPGLKNALLDQLNKTDTDLFPYELEQITELSATHAGIESLIGIQHCTNLTHLDLENNVITDLRPLTRLANLTDLNLRYNQIQELTPLAFLTGLRSLLLGGNELLEKLEPLEHLISIERLDLSRTGVENLGNLYGMEDLQEMYLSYCNGVDDVDLEVLIYMPNLKKLDLKGNNISNLEPLKGLTSLTDLDIRYGLIRDITPLATCTALTTLFANDNGIWDIEPLANLTSLKRLNLSKNPISDLRPLQGLVNLDALYLAANQIVDIAPLVHNAGLGNGDQVDITENPLDLTDRSDDMLNIQALIVRGVIMIGF